MQHLFFKIAAIKNKYGRINDRECSNKCLGKEQLIIGQAATNNQEYGIFLNWNCSKNII